MSRVFITGSSDGLGLMAAQLLVEQGHSVVLHARNQHRAEETKRKVPTAEAVLTADLSSLRQTRELAENANKLGRFDAVISNAAVGYMEPKRIETEDGLSHLFAINSLAPYVLTALLETPKRYIYVSSGMHLGGDLSLRDLQWTERSWEGAQAYSDSKLQNVLLAFGVARLMPSVSSNAMSPGWVPTKMGGSGANDDLQQAHLTQVWLATSNDSAATASGQYLYHLKPHKHLVEAEQAMFQDRYLSACQQLSGLRLPGM